MSGQQKQESVAARNAVKELFARKLAAGYTLAGIYTWRGEDEAVLFHRVRLDPPAGSAEEKFIRPIHQHEGRWRVGEPPAPRAGKPLYRLPQLLRADPARAVHVVEGEKAANALCALGLLATTSGSASSAARADWSPLRGREVRIWPDFDPPGARYGAEVAALAASRAVKVELLDVASLKLPQKGDAWDWRAATPGASAAHVASLPWRLWQPPSPQPAAAKPAAAVPRLRTVCMADVQPEEVQWLWPGFIAIGKLTLVAGDPGLGKSMITASLAAHVSRGRPWPVGAAPCPLGSVLLISGEDGESDTLRPRLDAAEADVNRVHTLQAVEYPDGHDRMLSLQSDVQALDTYLHQHPDVRLLCIDPVTAYLGNTDSYKNSEVRALLQPLCELAGKHRFALVIVSHLSKPGPNGSSNPGYRINGSVAFVAASRSVYSVRKDQHDPARRLVLPIKNNLSEDENGLAYRIGVGANGKPRVEWEGEVVRMGADEVQGVGEDDDGVGNVVSWLQELLAEGPVPYKELMTQASDAGFHPRAVQRARKRARVDSVRAGYGKESRCYWQLKRTPRAGAAVAGGSGDTT